MSRCERAALYKFLSECYYVPDESLLAAVRNLGRTAHAPYPELARTVPGTNGLETLKIDHSRLFIGPYKLLAPPYGSTYLDDHARVMTGSTMDVREWYREQGLGLAISGPPDHIIVELEFMHYLICRQIDADYNSDSAMQVQYAQKRELFVRSHLSRWIPDFVTTVEANAETDFYKTLARITKHIVSGEYMTAHR
jgi:TorA maturation chaperone TorD